MYGWWGAVCQVPKSDRHCSFPVRGMGCMGKQSYSTARAPSEGPDAQLDSGIVGRLAYLEA